MGIVTSQQLTKYYDQYREDEITYTKDIIRTLKLDPKQVFVKCNDNQWSCILNSASYQLARVIVGTKSEAFMALTEKDEAGNLPSVNLRLSFFQDGGQQISFYIAAKMTKISPYMNSKDLAVATLSFTQRPPDDFIEITGKLLEANANAVRRSDERITINDDSKRKLSLKKAECVMVVQSVPRHCILRDISFSGARVILVGLSKFLNQKEAVLQLEFDEPEETVSIRGMIVSADLIEGRKDLCSASIKFDENIIPLSYKLHVNNFLTTVRKTQLSASDQIEQQRAQQRAAELENERNAIRQGIDPSVR